MKIPFASARRPVLLGLVTMAAMAPAFPLHADSYELRAEALLSELRSRELPDPGGSGKMNFGIAAARLAADPNDAAAINFVTEGGLGGPDAPFNALYRLRAYLPHSDSFSSAQQATILQSMESVEEWNVNYTENHRVLLWSNAYLLAQAFPNGRWIWDGQSVGSTTLLANARNAIASFGREVFAKGYSDFLSPTYDLFKVAAWMNLYDFAEDPAVVRMADALLTYHFTLLAHGSHREVVLAPYSRGGDARFSDSLDSNSQWIAYLFWGINGANAAAATSSNRAEFILALTDWRPREALRPIALKETAPYTFQASQPSFFVDEPRHMMRTSWFGKGYAISSGVYRMRPQDLDTPGARQLVHDNAFALAWDSDNAGRYLYAMHPYWNSAEGENNWDMPSSPFQQIAQHRNTAILLYSIPPTDPFADAEPWAGQRAEAPLPVAQIRYPTLGLDYDEWSDDWVSLSHGSVYIAIKMLQPGWSRDRRALMAQGFHVLKSKGVAGETWNTGFLIEVGTAAEHGSLDAFMATVQANPLSVDWPSLTVDYTSSQGNRLAMTYNDSLQPPDFSVPEVSINGAPVDFSSWPVLHSPHANLQDRVLRLQTADPDQLWVADWSESNPVVELRASGPAPDSWAGFSLRSDGWVQTGDFLGWVYPDGDFVFLPAWQRWVFLPEDQVNAQGGWLHLPAVP